ncbi:LON peptidase N-terminal domain and RING finger protein 2 isoform X2 [Rhodnius prolixus]|uniref:LON peptidase N-terminal domain and RING finger protein 2 isoform X2 n=1 Tax=Rhodnius prolixus TaxID=13249 RepID=UPI003D18E1D2
MLTMQQDASCGVSTARQQPVCRVPHARLRHLASAMLDSVLAVSPAVTVTQLCSPPLSCPQCQWIPRRPVTLPCGHTSCRSCLLTNQHGCPKCGSALPQRLETNVMVKAAVEKWWPKEAEKERVKEEAALLVRNHLLEQALDKYTTALQLGSEDHLVLEARAEVLQKLSRYEEAHRDAELVTRLRPLWPKGYYRKGVILSSLGQYEEALLSFSVCAALENNADRVKNDFVKTLQKFLSPSKVVTSKRTPLAPWWLNNYNSQESTQKCGEDEIIDIFNKTAISNFPSFENKKLQLLLEKIFQEVERIKKGGICGHAPILVCDRVDPEDFECVLCCRTLWKPVTTPCGHTYCSLCLDRCLDYSPNCPLCMTSLSQYLCTSEKLVTEFLITALNTTLPEEYTSRLNSHLLETVCNGSIVRCDVDEGTVPVFVCTTGFPAVSCPLFVFEPRYRLMIRRAVESNGGRFGIAACVQQINGIKRYAEYGTLLQIKDWVLMNDGCSILSTVGMRRFKVMSRDERDGYDTSQVQYIVDDPIPQQSLQELTKLHDRVRDRGIKWFSQMSREMQVKILRSFGEMPPLESNWASLENGPAWSWWLVAILPLAQHLQVGILGTTCLEKRLRAIDKTLNHFDEQPSSIVKNLASSQESSLKRTSPQASRLT